MGNLKENFWHNTLSADARLVLVKVACNVSKLHVFSFVQRTVVETCLKILNGIQHLKADAHKTHRFAFKLCEQIMGKGLSVGWAEIISRPHPAHRPPVVHPQSRHLL